MKVVCAPDSFKESMSAAEAAAAMTRGVRSVFPDAQCVEVPMADGGEGTTEALVDALGGEWREVATVDALGRPITARYGLAPDGLVVIELAGELFGHPVRITATVRMGEGDVVDIERETELGGAIHSKGVLILSAFLAARYARHQPLSLSASLVFEQSYAPVEGDSASLAELCALLSALTQVPIQQRFAITGSVNQFGEVQVIGGVNEKIEGFFDLCSARGLDGTQGVVIPAASVRHLMLREDVVQAAAEGRFHIHAVKTVDEAMTVLTGVEAGEPDAKGVIPKGTLNHKIATVLAEMTAARHAYSDADGAAGARQHRRRHGV